MRKYSLLYTTLGLAILLWVLNLIALTLYLYWTMGWYDIMMHFLGGITIGMLVIWFLKIEDRSLKSFLTAVAWVIVVGGAYEVFEYVNDLTFSTQEYSIDTAIDLVMDALGAIFAYWRATSPSQ
ncbi:MAG: hypothetical protein Q8Q92_00225 [bacterium]|nr:hypothetical protein [bacterium]